MPLIFRVKSGRKNRFRIAREMAREEIDVISVCRMKNDVGKIVSDADGCAGYMGEV